MAEPHVIDNPNAQEFYIDGTIHLNDDPDVLHIVCYVERGVGESIERHEVVRLHMGRESYRRNLARAVERARIQEPRGH